MNKPFIPQRRAPDMSIAAKAAASLSKVGIQSATQKDLGLYLSTGVPNVDYIVSGYWRGGGLKTSRIYEIAGPAAAGKTLLAQHVMKEAQMTGGLAAFHDHEGTFEPELFKRFGGYTDEGLFSLQTPRSFEESLDTAIDWMKNIRDNEIIPFESPLVVVFDSLAMMVPHANLERDKSVSANMRERLALSQACSSELPALQTFVRENNAIAIFLNHLKEKPGVINGDPRYTPGGSMVDFVSSARLWLRNVAERDGTEVIGKKISMETFKNKTYRDKLKTSWLFKFDEDNKGYIDVIDTMVGFLMEHKVLEMSGAYIVWDGKKKYRKQLVPELQQTPEESLELLVQIAEKHFARGNESQLPVEAV